jgi:hypothetical protein
VTSDPDEHNPQDSTTPREESTTETIPRDTSGLKTETRADEADNASTLTAQTSGASETVQPAAPDAEDTNEPDDSRVCGFLLKPISIPG